MPYDNGMGRLAKKTVGGLDVLGYSVAGEETVVAVPAYNVCFDIGRAPREVIPIDNVCLSHGHMDHAAGLAYYFSQRGFLGTSPGRLIVHRSLAQPIQKLMDIWSDIEGHVSPGNVIGVEHLEDVPIRRGLIVRPFNTNHAAGALGYTLIEVRHKLKEEFLGKTGPQLVALKKEGVQIEERLEVPIVTFTGDTAIGRFLEHDFVRTSRVLMIECTFFEADHHVRAKAGRHIHVDQLPAVLEAVPDAQVLLLHVSRRTDLREAKRILHKVVSPKDRDRLTMLMDRPPRQRGDARRDQSDAADRTERLGVESNG